MTPAALFGTRWRSRQRPAMISVHRGLWGPAPENSLAAISAAQNYDIIEIDTQIASDGIPVVIHDPDLMRTAGSDLRPADTDHVTLTAQHLRQGAGGQGAMMTDQRVPTLIEALQAGGPNAFFDIDVKFPTEIVAVAKAVSGANLQQKGSIKIDTKTRADINDLLTLQERFNLMIMAKVVLPDAGLDHIRDLTRAGVAAAEVWFDDLNQLKEACKIAADTMAISTFTLDPVHCCGLSDTRALSDHDAVWGELMNAGVTILMTDQAPILDTYMANSSG